MTPAFPGLAHFRGLLEAYSQAVCERDFDALRRLHAFGGWVVYVNGDPVCNTQDLDAHLRCVERLLLDGKAKEFGRQEPLDVRGLTAFASGQTAVVTATFYGQGAADPRVRATFVLAIESDAWKVRRVHFLLDRNEEDSESAGLEPPSRATGIQDSRLGRVF